MDISNNEKNINKIVSFLKEKGFIYPGSLIYGGLRNTWDYGPFGTIIKNKVKNLWINYFIDNEKTFLIDSSIFLKQKVWKASKHLDKFKDNMVDCKSCKKRFVIDQEKINNCIYCGSKKLTSIKKFNLMINTNIGSSEKKIENISLRPELAQGIFINFNNIQKSMNLSLPFGVGSVGKSFRNEITPGHFIYKMWEFEQMELEYFFDPIKNNEDKIWNFFIEKTKFFLEKILFIDKSNLKLENIPKKDLAHYSSDTIDFNYNFNFGFKELLGIANRKNYDLSSHNNSANEKLLINCDGKKIIPNVIEVSFGVDRLFYAIILQAFSLKKINEKKERIILKLPFNLAPYQYAVLPLKSNNDKNAKIWYEKLKPLCKNILFSKKGNIGKRYYYHDSIGTYFCITFDNESERKNNPTCTIRNRNTSKQEVILLSEIENFIIINNGKNFI